MILNMLTNIKHEQWLAEKRLAKKNGLLTKIKQLDMTADKNQAVGHDC